MAKRHRKRFRTLHELVASYPRTVTQGAIARDLGISDSSLSNYLKGKPVGSATALRLHREFGLELAGMLEDRTTA